MSTGWWRRRASAICCWRRRWWVSFGLIEASINAAFLWLLALLWLESSGGFWGRRWWNILLYRWRLWNISLGLKFLLWLFFPLRILFLINFLFFRYIFGWWRWRVAFCWRWRGNSCGWLYLSFRRLWPVLFVIFSHLFMNFRRRWWGDIFMATWYDDLCRGRRINSLLFLGMMESRRWRWWWWVSNSGRWD